MTADGLSAHRGRVGGIIECMVGSLVRPMVRSESVGHIGVGSRRLAAVAGAGALLALGLLMSGCGNGGQPAPSSTPTTTTTSSSVATTPSTVDKDLNPNGPNLFTPPARNTPPERNP